MTDQLDRLLDEYRDAVRGENRARCDRSSHTERTRQTRAAILAYFERHKVEGGEDAERLSARITEYLSAGGLWNPECMDHDKVRRLLIDCRTEFDAAIADSAIKAAIAQVDAARTEGKGNG